MAAGCENARLRGGGLGNAGFHLWGSNHSHHAFCLCARLLFVYDHDGPVSVGARVSGHNRYTIEATRQHGGPWVYAFKVDGRALITSERLGRVRDYAEWYCGYVPKVTFK